MPKERRARRARSIHILDGAQRAMLQLGFDWRGAFAEARIEPGAVGDPEATVSEAAVLRLFELLPGWTGDPGIGLHIADNVDPRASDILDYLLLSSPTVHQGLERVVRFQRLAWFSEWIWLEEGSDHVFLRIGEEPPNAAFDDYSALVSLRYLDWITEVHFKPAEVRFRHPPTVDPSEYEALFHCPAKFDASQTGLTLPRALLDQPSMHASEEVARIHEEYAERLLEGLDDESVARRVKLTLEAQLENGPPDLASIARALHMSSRSLQRRLAVEGTSYSEVLTSLRRELALYWLGQGRAIQEVSYLTGFAEVSAFTRAMRRWTGETPGAYQRRRTGEAR
jgi:AraC-like DNA-binding protein